MNGRVYDPLVARMISADPTVPDAMNAQAWNRYSYVGNDPLAFTDPSGFSWLSDLFHGIANFLTNNPIVRAIVQIVATVVLVAVLGPGVIAAIVSAATSAAAVTGLSGGNIGQILRAGAIAGATALAFNFIGDITLGTAHASPFDSAGNLTNPAGYAGNIAGHAGVGCLTAAASGGQCGPGALSGAAGAAATPLVDSVFTKGSVGAIAASAAVGGLASVAGGGKFADGAVTAAFGYMFNDAIIQLQRGGGAPEVLAT
jgi:hypothetical protein